jgi:hypothetical protein
LDRQKNLQHRPEKLAVRPAPKNPLLERLSPASSIPTSPAKTVPSARSSVDDTVDSGRELPTAAERRILAVDPGPIRLSCVLVCEGLQVRQPIAQSEVPDLLEDKRAYLWIELWS